MKTLCRFFCEKVQQTFGQNTGKYIPYMHVPLLVFHYMWMHENVGLTFYLYRFPVVIRPPANLIVLVVLLLQPFNERLKILHERLCAHFGLAGYHGQRLGPRLAKAQLHHITANSTGQRGGQRDKDQ